MRHDLHAAKTRNYWPAAVACGLALGLGASLVEAAPPIEMGVWINHTGKGAVEIRPCGTSGASANRLCGFIVWLKEPNKRNGEPLTDGHNPDAGQTAAHDLRPAGSRLPATRQRRLGQRLGLRPGARLAVRRGHPARLARSARPHRLQGREVLLQVVHVEARARRPAALRPAARGAGDTERCAPCRCQDDLRAGAAAQGAAPRSRRAAGNGRVEPSFRPAHSALKKPGRMAGLFAFVPRRSGRQAGVPRFSLRPWFCCGASLASTTASSVRSLSRRPVRRSANSLTRSMTIGR